MVEFQKLRMAFVRAQVTQEDDVQPWLKVAQSHTPGTLLNHLIDAGLVIPEDAPSVVEGRRSPAGFRSQAHQNLARYLCGRFEPGEESLQAELNGAFHGPFSEDLFQLFENVLGDVRRPPREELARYVSVRAIGIDPIWEILEQGNHTSSRQEMFQHIDALEYLWIMDVSDPAKTSETYYNEFLKGTLANPRTLLKLFELAQKACYEHKGAQIERFQEVNGGLMEMLRRKIEELPL